MKTLLYGQKIRAENLLQKVFLFVKRNSNKFYSILFPYFFLEKNQQALIWNKAYLENECTNKACAY